MTDNIISNKHVYHMVHLSNLESILHQRAFLSRDKVQAADIKYNSIAEDSVQRLRNRVYIWNFLERQWRPIHSYVPFYFAKLTPMLFRRKDIQHNLIFFEVGRSILKDSGVVFSDGNVTNQQLAQAGMQRVFIVPATAKNPFCKRWYSSGNPSGTNSSCSDVYADPMFLQNLNWTVINDRWFNNDLEKRRIKHAEVLVPDIVPLSKIEGISAWSQEKANEVNALIRQHRLERQLPKAIWKPDFYF